MENQNLDDERYSWDWTKQDVELAEEHKLSRERIRQIRAKLDMPKSVNHYRHRPAKNKLNHLLAITDEEWLNHSNVELAKKYGSSYGSVSHYRNYFNKPKYKTKIIYPDWTKDINLIAEELKMKKFSAYIKRRRLIKKYFSLTDLRELNNAEKQTIFQQLNEKLKLEEAV